MTTEPITLTLGAIRAHHPCESGWRKLCTALGTSAPDTVLGIGDVLLSNGRADALWCLRALQPRERVAMVLPGVKRASAHTTDARVHDCVAAIDRWLAGDDAVDLEAAAWAAWDAAAAAARAAEAVRAAEAAARAAEAARARWAAEAEIAAQHDDWMRLSPPVVMTPEARHD